MYFGDPYVIDVPSAEGSITIYQPSLDDIIKIGHKRFIDSLGILVTNTTSYRMILWDMGLDWNVISDFELFLMLYKSVDKEVSHMLFGGDVDLSTFQIYKKTTESTEKVIIYNEELKVEIDEQVYFHVSQYLRKAFNMQPEEKLTNDSIMKKWFIEKDKRQLEIDKKKKGDEKSSPILSLISSCVNHPGFKYNIQELRNITMCQFYDSVHRLQIYESSTAVLKGMYSGFVDSKKLKPEDYNFMK